MFSFAPSRLMCGKCLSALAHAPSFLILSPTRQQIYTSQSWEIPVSAPGGGQKKYVRVATKASWRRLGNGRRWQLADMSSVRWGWGSTWAQPSLLRADLATPSELFLPIWCSLRTSNTNRIPHQQQWPCVNGTDLCLCAFVCVCVCM